MHFSHVGLIESSHEEGDVPAEEDQEEEGAAKKIQARKAKEMCNLASTELVFPFKSILLVIAGIPNNFLPLCGPEIQSHYHCQVHQCNLDFAQKTAACTHVQHDHLNMALACRYCSFEDNPKMHWYSTTAWGNHTMKHLKDNLPIFLNDPAFAEKFIPQSSGYVSPSTSKQALPHQEEVIK